jgi:uncharacterized membrane protein YphA (DoxX/SURF4 family)
VTAKSLRNRSARAGRPAWTPPAGRWLARLAGAKQAAANWAPTAGRVLLGLVLAWFGYHELVQPRLWTGYVPVVPSGSTGAVLLVLVHGWLLLMLAAAMVAGIAVRAAAAVTAVLLAQIVLTLAITGGLSDLTLRDLGVLGLAVCLTGGGPQRLTV